MTTETIDKTHNGVLRQLAALQKMTQTEMLEKWRDIYGAEPPPLSRGFLLKRLAYRIQELYYGGLPQPAKEKLQQHMEDYRENSKCSAGKNSAEVKRILPGARFLREWHGQRHEVIIRENGFEYNGQIYRSLSAIAQKITGTKWNGPAFFGVSKIFKKGE